MEKINNPHDLYFKETLSKQENARSFLQSYLPANVLELIDLSQIEIEKDSFVTAELQQYFSDLLYRVDFRGRQGYIYILFEHKSYQETWIGLQLLEYMLQCWKRKKEQRQKLPIIVPLVIYHGKDHWRQGQRLSDLFECTDQSLCRYIPDSSICSTT